MDYEAHPNNFENRFQNEDDGESEIDFVNDLVPSFLGLAIGIVKKRKAHRVPKNADRDEILKESINTPI
jgi:hypothetical protein